MINEIGHFALVLALCIAALQAVVPLIGAARNDAALMAWARPAALAQFLFVGTAFFALMHAYAVSDFSLANVAANSNSMKPLLYKLSGVWSNHEGSMLLWVFILALFGAAVAAVQPQPAAGIAGARPRRPGDDRGRLSVVHPVDLEPVPAAVPGPRRRRRAQPDPAGPRPRLSSALPLSRLCRVFDLVLLCHRRPDRGPGRPGLGALGAAVDLGGVVRPDHRHRDGQLVGLLHARLGRLVVLGPGRERLVHAVAGRHRAVAFGDRRREARRAQNLDDPARHHHLLAEPPRHLPGALRGVDLGPRLRLRPAARRLHPLAAEPLYRRRAAAFCLARAAARRRRPVRADFARGRAVAEQSAADDRGRDGLPRHALSAVPRCRRASEGIGRPALLHDDLCADHGPAADRDGGRAAAAVEARRPAGGAGPPQIRVSRDRGGGARDPGGDRRAFDLARPAGSRWRPGCLPRR